MSDDIAEIVELIPLPEFRLWTPDPNTVPARWERKYWCKTSDGLWGKIWVPVEGY